jgi:hypothetical protein
VSPDVHRSIYLQPPFLQQNIRFDSQAHQHLPSATMEEFGEIPHLLCHRNWPFSYEFTPSVVASKPSGKPGTSKTSNLLFDPGPMFRFKNNFNIIARLALETAGRYGFTPVFNKVYLKTKVVNYFVAGSLPVRFGNSAPHRSASMCSSGLLAAFASLSTVAHLIHPAPNDAHAQSSTGHLFFSARRSV